MREIFFCIMIFMAALASSGFCQYGDSEYASEKKNAISINPVGMLLGYAKSKNLDVTVEFQKALNNYMATSVIPEAIIGQYIGGGLMTSFYVFPGGKSLRGFYINGLIGAGLISSYYYYNIGGDLGYQFISRNGFLFNLGIGLQYVQTQYHDAALNLMIRLDMGFAWGDRNGCSSY